MPDNIVIDNYHDKGVHVYPYSGKHEEEIKINTENKIEVYKKVIDYIEENEGLQLEKLILELKK
jgi:hypothetical protein